ncbi:MAG: tetratricopeptide repeat protein [Candidatus Cryptobacteroides sp.]
MRRLLLYIIFLSISAMASTAIAFAQYDKDAFMMRGRIALSDGKYSQAIENFNILARLDTTDYWTFFFRGIAKYNLSDLRGAQKDFDTAVRLNPVFTSGYHYRAITYSRFGKYEEALADLEKAISLRPGFIGLYYSRGVTYFLSSQFDKALKDFDKYIRKEPRDPAGYLNRGACQLFLTDTTKAFADYNKAIKLDRFDPEGYIRRGRLYAAKKEYDSGIADMNKAIELDPDNTLAYFTRAIMYYETKDYVKAMKDLDKVLEDDPGNALTLYNRSLIKAQVGAYDEALADMDRVININPSNVLAYFNRASIFIEMERWTDALEDYDKAIELYPDFAKAYMNRSYVKNMLGDRKSSKEDYDIARKKVDEYRNTSGDNPSSFADTTKKYSSLIEFDADFAKKDFDNELLQHRDIDIRLKPLYRFVASSDRGNTRYALSGRFENPLIDRFRASTPIPVSVTNSDTVRFNGAEETEALLYGSGESALGEFCKALCEYDKHMYNTAMNHYDKAISMSQNEGNGLYDNLYSAFYLMNRGVLRAEMIDVISSIESNVQVLTMDDTKTTRARVRDNVSKQYDYSEAIADLEAAAAKAGDIPYIHFNLGNLHCLASEHLESIESYTKAIRLYPLMGEAYYNRGLVLIYLKDKEKGCIDMSRAGELGVSEAYGVIKKYCETENE